MTNPNIRPPWWFAVLLLVVSVPALIFSNAAYRVLGESGWVMNDLTGWLYPAYVIISAFSAWFVYPTRRTLAWVLLLLVLLTDLAFCAISF